MQKHRLRCRANESPPLQPVDAPTTVADSALTGPASTPPTDSAARFRAAVVGAGGGVGTSTLARDLGYEDLGTTLPCQSVRGLVIAAKSTSDGMAAALACVQQLGFHLGRVVVAVVDDGCGPQPVAVKSRSRLLHGRVHAVVDVPYVPVWRYAGTNEPPTTAYLDVIRRLGSIVTPVTYS